MVIESIVLYFVWYDTKSYNEKNRENSIVNVQDSINWKPTSNTMFTDIPISKINDLLLKNSIN